MAVGSFLNGQVIPLGGISVVNPETHADQQIIFGFGIANQYTVDQSDSLSTGDALVRTESAILITIDPTIIGSNTNLVAPVTVEENAFIGAGSTITKDVPDSALAVTRADLRLKENWRKKK